METVKIVKCCLACKHLDIDPGCADYSELTPGEDAEVICRAPNRYHFGDLDFAERLKESVLIKAASECGSFELNPKLVPHKNYGTIPGRPADDNREILTDLPWIP